MFYAQSTGTVISGEERGGGGGETRERERERKQERKRRAERDRKHMTDVHWLRAVTRSV